MLFKIVLITTADSVLHERAVSPSIHYSRVSGGVFSVAFANAIGFGAAEVSIDKED